MNPEESIESTSLYIEDYFLQEDITILLTLMLFVAVFSLLLTWIINFIPDFMRSFVRKVRNKSMIYDADYLDRGELNNGELERKTLGDDLKGFAEKWFNKIRTWR